MRHGLVLAVAGLAYVAMGTTYITSHPSEHRTEALFYALEIMDYNSWGLVFVAVGIIAVISSRWPPISETWGYTVLTGQSVAWSGFYAAGVLFNDANLTYLSGTFTWALIGFLWWSISGLINPSAVQCLLTQLDALQAENEALHSEVDRLKN